MNGIIGGGATETATRNKDSLRLQVDSLFYDQFGTRTRPKAVGGTPNGEEVFAYYNVCGLEVRWVVVGGGPGERGFPYVVAVPASQESVEVDKWDYLVRDSINSVGNYQDMIRAQCAEDVPHQGRADRAPTSTLRMQLPGRIARISYLEGRIDAIFDDFIVATFVDMQEPSSESFEAEISLDEIHKNDLRALSVGTRFYLKTIIRHLPNGAVEKVSRFSLARRLSLTAEEIYDARKRAEEFSENFE